MSDGPELSRRKVLGGLSAIGASAALGGASTVAFFADEETFANDQLTAGELDLKVDWQEHYYDGRGAEAEFAESIRTDPPEEDGYVPLPTMGEPAIWLPEELVDELMDATAVEAFPDVDDDGIQEPEVDPCETLADLPEGLDPMDGARTLNEDTYGSLDGEGSPQPLINLDDVKPGDFGEVTFSLHLCDNPGYVWMNGTLDEEVTAENGVTEPESLAEGEEEGVVELLDATRAAIWYDVGEGGWGDAEDDGEGDNVQQPTEPDIVAAGTLRTVLNVLSQGYGVPLDADPSAGVGLVQTQASTASETAFDCVEVEKPGQGIVECADVHPEWLGVGKVETDEPGFPAEGETESFQTAAGTVWIHTVSAEEGQPTEIAFDADFPVSGVLLKGGPDSHSCTPSGAAVSSGTIGFDHTASDPLAEGAETLSAPTNPKNGKPYAISNVQFCVAPGGGGEQQNGDRECFVNSTSAYVGFAWWVPREVGNEIQSDSVGFDLGFYTEQCRHNDGSGVTQSVDLSTGTADWQVVDHPEAGFDTPAPALETVPHPVWADPDCAAWVDPYGDDAGATSDPQGTYTYETTFTIEGGSGRCDLTVEALAADNGVELALDGTPIADSGGSSAFTSPLGPVTVEDVGPGTHTLTATVENFAGGSGNPSGLLVCAEVGCGG